MPQYGLNHHKEVWLMVTMQCPTGTTCQWLNLNHYPMS